MEAVGWTLRGRPGPLLTPSALWVATGASPWLVFVVGAAGAIFAVATAASLFLLISAVLSKSSYRTLWILALYAAKF